jgi:hypothetical protein
VRTLSVIGFYKDSTLLGVRIPNTTLLQICHPAGVRLPQHALLQICLPLEWRGFLQIF